MVVEQRKVWLGSGPTIVGALAPNKGLNHIYSKTMNTNAHILVDSGLQLERDQLKFGPRIANYYTSSQDPATETRLEASPNKRYGMQHATIPAMVYIVHR